MNNKLTRKFIASTMLLTFMLTNATPTVIAAGNEAPAIRSEQAITSLELSPNAQLPNADSLVNLSLRDADIKQVLRMFADQAGLNIIFAPGVSGSVTMDLVNVTLAKALNLVVSTNKIRYDIKANTMIITGENGKDMNIETGEKDMILVPVKYVSAASIADFLNKNFFNENSTNPGTTKKPVVSVNPANNELIIMGTRSDALLAQKIIEQFDKKPTITNIKVNHVTPAEMAGLVCSTLIPSFMSKGEETGGAAGITTGGAAGVPTGFASDSFGGDNGGISIGGGKLLCSVDQKAESGEDIENLPFKNMTISYFPTLGTIQIIGGSDSQIEVIKEYVAENDIKSPQAYLEVQIISLKEEGMKELTNNWKYRSKTLSVNAGGGGISTANPIFFSGHGFTDADTSSSESSTSTAYKRYEGTPQLIWEINYMVSNNKGRTLANPRILITSGQQSVIDLTSDYVAKTTSQYLDSTGTGSSQVQKDYDIQSDNGIKITITPFISPDGYVTLDIKPEYATIADTKETPNEAGGTDIAATLLQRNNLDLKGVRIKDGETLIIGGLIREQETKGVSKIPLLGDLPIVGVLFRSTVTSRVKEETIIMITPEILLDTEDAANDEIDL